MQVLLPEPVGGKSLHERDPVHVLRCECLAPATGFILSTGFRDVLKFDKHHMHV
jgi:hypothetical protein